MAKYSTGDGGGGAGESCELCGAEGVDLSTASVAGATLQVCSDCADHGDDRKTDDSGGERDDQGVNRKKRAAQNTARMHDAGKGDAAHWEDGADYDDDPLPYLVSEYGDRLTEARQDAGLQPQELAAEIDVPESDLLAIEQGRATQAGIGGSVIEALEAELDVDLSEDS
jgi:ribosome-binding protein aMBF1 (putative translation factor)